MTKNKYQACMSRVLMGTGLVIFLTAIVIEVRTGDPLALIAMAIINIGWLQKWG